VQGNWPTASSMLSKLTKGGTVSAEEVFMTIVRPESLLVRAQVEEKDLALVPAGATARVTPTALPEAKLAARVEKVGAVPIGGSFEVRLALDPGARAAARVVPGMTCTVKVTAYARDQVVVVPAVAVFAEELNEDQHYVYRYADGKPQKQTVDVGKRSAGKAEILKGLNAGEEILLAKP
jgi:multidrug efflux pump subunit AcrA (membrane-fusion protein)